MSDIKKVEVYLKDPDGFYESITDAVNSWEHGIEDAEIAELAKEKMREKVSELLEKWVEYGEYISLVFDLENGTAIVKERGR